MKTCENLCYKVTCQLTIQCSYSWCSFHFLINCFKVPNLRAFARCQMSFLMIQLQNCYTIYVHTACSVLELLYICSHRHNYQRITRILMSVAMLGASYLQVPLVTALINEIFVHKTLPNAASSCQNYWIPSVLDDRKKQKLFDAVKSFQNYC